MQTITPDDTASIFVGSGALDYPWYQDVEMTGIDFVDQSAADWSVSLVHVDPDHGTEVASVTINHQTIMKAVRDIIAGKAKGVSTTGETTRQCKALIFKGPDETDFDACSADNVIQVAAFGESIYG